MICGAVAYSVYNKNLSCDFIKKLGSRWQWPG
jgi:hypothetical protein